MILDTSALIAILCDEPDRRTFTEAIEEAGPCAMSAASLVETSIVIESRFGAEGGRNLDLLLAKAGIDIVAVDAEQAEIARRAFRQFGKGRHPAGLNFGDCFAYALAEARRDTLLFKGNDFAQTDVASALPISNPG